MIHTFVESAEKSNEPTKVIQSHPIPSDPFEESVYALIPQELVAPPKKERYRSKFAGQARAEYVKDRKTSASMGPAKVVVNHPKEFLKKGERELKSHSSKFFKVNIIDVFYSPDKTVRKAPVPKEPGLVPPKTTKDFVKLNALENINSGMFFFQILLMISCQET